jgi:hypothetical protein
MRLAYSHGMRPRLFVAVAGLGSWRHPILKLLSTVLLVAAGFLATAAAASAQAPVASFDALAGRLRIGQRIWVTDATGREVDGALERLSSDGLVLQADGLVTFAATDVRRVRARDRDSLKNGTLIGLGIGGAMGAAWCIGAIVDDSGDIDAPVECAEGVTVFPGLGALIGLAVDAVIPGKMREIYQASLPPEASRAGVRVLPLLSSRVKGLAVSFAF